MLPGLDVDPGKEGKRGFTASPSGARGVKVCSLMGLYWKSREGATVVFFPGTTPIISLQHKKSYSPGL